MHFVKTFGWSSSLLWKTNLTFHWREVVGSLQDSKRVNSSQSFLSDCPSFCLLQTGRTLKTSTRWHNSSLRIHWWTRTKPSRILWTGSWENLSSLWRCFPGFSRRRAPGLWFHSRGRELLLNVASPASLSKHLPSADTMAFNVDVDELENSHGATYVRKKAAKVTGENQTPKEQGCVQTTSSLPSINSHLARSQFCDFFLLHTAKEISKRRGRRRKVCPQRRCI